MERNKRLSLLVGFGAFLCAVLVHEFIVERAKSGAIDALAAHGGSHDGVEPVSAPDAEGGRTQRTPTAAEDSEASPARARAPLATLADLLSRDAGWQLMDLSDWRTVDAFGGMLALSLPQVVKLGPADQTELVQRLREARSVRMRQVLLVALGSIGAEVDEALLLQHLDESGTVAASAFALGRCGTASALDILLARASDADAPWATRETMYFGLAQVGSPAVEHLVRAAEVLIARKRAPASDSLVACVRSPDAWPALRELALHHPEAVVRNMAIRASLISGRTHRDAATAAEFGWLARVAGDASEDAAVRGDALRGIAMFDAAQGRRLVDELLDEYEAGPDLVAVALEVAGLAGVSDGSLARVVALAAADGHSALRDAALDALVLSRTANTDRALAQLLPSLDGEHRAAVLARLTGRAAEAGTGASEQGESATPELAYAVSALLDEPNLGAAERYDAMMWLSADDAYRERVSDLAWREYAGTVGEAYERRDALIRLAPVIGKRAAVELIAEFRRTDELVDRVALASALVGLRDGDGTDEVAEFFRSTTMPYLREALPANTGALLAGVGPRTRSVNMLAITLSNLFGRYGERSDVELLDSLAERFASDHADWPQRLAATMHDGVVEASARAIDLIALRGES